MEKKERLNFVIDKDVKTKFEKLAAAKGLNGTQYFIALVNEAYECKKDVLAKATKMQQQYQENEKEFQRKQLELKKQIESLMQE